MHAWRLMDIETDTMTETMGKILFQSVFTQYVSSNRIQLTTRNSRAGRGNRNIMRLFYSREYETKFIIDFFTFSLFHNFTYSSQYDIATTVALPIWSRLRLAFSRFHIFSA